MSLRSCNFCGEELGFERRSSDSQVTCEQTACLSVRRGECLSWSDQEASKGLFPRRTGARLSLAWIRVRILPWICSNGVL